MSPLDRWWEAKGSLHRFVTDLVAGELALLRPAGELPSRPWPAELSLVGDELGCDSLELLSLATAVAEAVLMHESGIEDYLLARRTIGDWVALVAASLDRFSAQVAFRSSGSTGRPKPCRHGLDALIQEITELAECLPDRRRLLCAVPAHHIYGFLFTVLLPAHLDVEVIEIRGRLTAALASELRGGDLVIGHPAFWTAFARTVPVVPADVIGVTSTAPCPPELAGALLDSGLRRLVQVYGSSETSGIGYRDRPDGSYRLLSFWRRGAGDSCLIRALPTGEEAIHEAPDRLQWTADEEFGLSARRDGAVQVGGVNVSPAAIGARLCEHPNVADAVVRLMAPDEGSRLKAFIVPGGQSANATRLRADLTAWCNANLTVAERPKAFTFGPAAPRGALGKPADWAISGPA